ncbi:GntR family transcriptional regulator [Mesorhizobium sp. SB112]|uniref:GntR family transcriptional regulator n=1 Tax=Mesorhizobium sp. SB112 TaxID=3151853 RepID=UPI0032632720
MSDELRSNASSLVSDITRRIGDLIRSGEIEAGGRLTTQWLADKFGVSRSPVREALDILQTEGLVEQLHHRGFFVRTDDPSAMRQASAPSPREGRNAYQLVAEDWLTDRIPDEITEQMLRERYDLTKGQVSDILIRAAREGWAERKQGYGWRLLPVAKSSEAFEQIYRLRVIIEPAGFLEPTFKIDLDALREQRQIQERMLECDIENLSGEQLLDNGARFHEELMRMSGNAFLHMSLVRVNRMRRLLEYRSNVDRARLSTQCADHLRILDVLERNEIIEASYLMKQHLLAALQRKSPLHLPNAGE